MAFQLVCEIEPPTKPDLKRVRHQIGTLTTIADTFLIPDNHIGRATVSSVAVAHEVQAMGGRSIACLNSRDRNLLGFRRDLLTAAAYGVDRFLFVYGDKPASGNRTSDLTVRSMIEEAREFSPGVQVGAAAGARPLPAWKRAADFLFVQAGFSLEALLRWREANQVEVPVYAGVIVIASERHARTLSAAIPDIAIPEDLVRRVAADRMAGVDAACERVLAIRDSGAFDGVHLIPVSRYRDVEARLSGVLR
ncbi:methylenetetrahydrofolate reductase [Nonomuraea sp. 3-1Str]|uniref:methylenetetrahydrofolate reductase n=1 Tax=unclassified Nonomuraea TaxID=2593643 RepID=UPI00285640F8|nr:methylenetetrahydrofolate reductase [Nonomuraea sp. 3-1Str]MDR8415050.1 methylenetetrahydrofolate reductase [Nonomuraea sp. 3-1Str]